MRAKPVTFHPEATAEAKAALLWYADRSKTVAARFLEEIQSGVELISQGPHYWMLIDSQCRRYVLRRFPYALIFRERDEVIQVIAVAHGHRRPGYWRKRS